MTPGLRTLSTKPYWPLTVDPFLSEVAGCGEGSQGLPLRP